MDLWEIFVLAQVRLCMNISYDELHFMANDSELVRGIMGVLRTDFKTGKQYSYQGIYDNVTLLDDELLTQINDVILENIVMLKDSSNQIFRNRIQKYLDLKVIGTGNTAPPCRCTTRDSLQCTTP